MKARWRVLLGLAALVGLVAVAAGAFGEHGETNPSAKDWLKTSAEYGLAHALAVYAAIYLAAQGSRTAETAAWLLLAGGLVFSWSLDAMAITGNTAIGMLTPVGGPLMLCGWLALAIAAFLGLRRA